MMQKPNIVIMLMDNIGYGDPGCYGNRLHRTPNIDRLAEQGMRFTDYYSTSGVCTPSRASLMTGCYPRRVNLHESGRGHAVLRPTDPKGLHPEETTIASLLKTGGYATACVGKWHLGDQQPFLPPAHGFDRFFGCPYSEDMVPGDAFPDWPPLPLMRGNRVVEAGPDRNFLTQRYTREAVSFIRENQDKPFFLFLSQAMPGSTDRPFASPDFQGCSANGPYGDAVEELDWSAGEVLGTLRELGLDEKTLVVWTSDNGAVGWDPPQGSNAPLRGCGYNTSEGGQRVPCIVRWPGRVPAGNDCRRLTTMMDWLPTAAGLAGLQMPADRVIDGHDLRPLLFEDPSRESAYEEGFYYYHMHQLQAVRLGDWKLYLPLERKIDNLQGDLSRGRPAPAELFDVCNDPGETREQSVRHPRIVRQLADLAQRARRELGDEEHAGRGQRPAGWVDQPRPQLLPGG